MNYLLETNACIAIINDRPDAVRLRYLKVLDGGAQVWASSVVAFELWYAVAKRSRAKIIRTLSTPQPWSTTSSAKRTPHPSGCTRLCKPDYPRRRCATPPPLDNLRKNPRYGELIGD